MLWVSVWVGMAFLATGCKLLKNDEESASAPAPAPAPALITLLDSEGVAITSRSFEARERGTSSDITVTVTNSGGTAATTLAGVFYINSPISLGDPDPFAFKGGVFPGTGGTCATTLEPGSSCTLVLTFAPLTPAYMSNDYTAAFVVNFNDSVTALNGVILNLAGTGSYCANGSTAVVQQTSISVGSAAALNATTQFVAQKITPATDQVIKKVLLSQYNGVGTNVGMVNVGIYTDNSGAPGTTAVASVEASPVIQTSSRSWITYTLDTPAVLTAGTVYWIVAKYISLTGGLTYVDKYTSDAYTGGNYFYSNNSGTTWADNAPADLSFQLEGCI
jgi:hypothetical protein